MSTTRRANLASLCLVLASLPFIIIFLARQTRAQASDGDEQFQAYHQDIGRISGVNKLAQVAPQSTIVERAPALPVPAQTRPNLILGHPAGHPAPATAGTNPARKPKRVTLVARREPVGVISGAAPVAPVAAPTPLQGAIFAPLAAGASNGPALASFQASSGLPVPTPTQSISSRHSALMAEVAAERAARQQASLGSPIEALSSPVASIQVQQQQAPVHHSQVQQPPPQLQHQHQHQAEPAIEVPAFVAAGQEEPQPAPSFEQVLGQGCPRKGVYSWENKEHCDRYYMCTNGTFTEEACPNGLAYGQQGAVYQHCAYNWNIDCGRKKAAEPISSPGCPWQFGIFPILQNGRCSIDYYVCEWGVPEPKRCSPEGLFYDDRIKGCQWADQLGCKSEALLNFKCPAEDEENPYWPYPRYYHNTQDVIVCVNEQPRLVHCNPDQLVDPSSLACIDVKKKKKQF